MDAYVYIYIDAQSEVQEGSFNCLDPCRFCLFLPHKLPSKNFLISSGLKVGCWITLAIVLVGGQICSAEC